MSKIFRALSLVLTFILLSGLMVFGASAKEETAEWDYYNSISVLVTVAEQTTFTPQSFPEVDCSKVIVTSKEIYNGYRYELILVLNKSGSDEELEAAITAVKANKMVAIAGRNPFAPFDSEITLNQSQIKLKVGQQADLQIVAENIYCSQGESNLLRITLDSETYNLANIDKNIFADYGVTLGEQYIINSAPSGQFEATTDSKTVRETIDIINSLSQLPGVRCVDFNYLPNGARPSESWVTSNNACVSFTEDLSTDEKIFTIGKTATVEGLKSGTAEISVTRTKAGSGDVTAKCTVFVYTPGDVTESNTVEIDDAIMLFQHIAGKKAFEPNQLNAADVNEDGSITLSDAILLFKHIAGKS